MNKQEFLAASLPYGIKIKDSFSPIRLTGIMGNEYHFGSSLSIEGAENVAPIIRPLSDLTKECVQKDYNNGEPFIPIVELAKIAFPKIRNFTLKDGCVDLGHGYTFLFRKDSFDCRRGYNGKTWDYHCPILNQLQLFQLLWKWHFWPNKPENEEVVWVTEEFNPYK